MSTPQRILVSGAAGFVGSHVAARLLALGHEVCSVDNFNDYYSPQLKQDRVAALLPGHTVLALDVADEQGLSRLVADFKPHSIVHLAAQAGVRYSLQAPFRYVEANLKGFTAILEAARHNGVAHVVYASSSSVYGANTEVPFSETQRCDHPLSLYAATKRANELMAESYAHLFGLKLTGLRFFTVYGPWGRPDMAPILFGRAILRGETIAVFNHGEMERDFTYIDDIVGGVLGALTRTQPDRHRVYNLGNHTPVRLLDFIQVLSDACGRPAQLRMEAMAPGDMQRTFADTARAEAELRFRPSTSIQQGLPALATWLKSYDQA
jgi:UDP-glucuronate 4-epimerase